MGSSPTSSSSSNTGQVDSRRVSAESGESSLRVVLVDDHQVVRSGLKALIDAEPDIEVVGEADTARGGVQVTEDVTPDVVVMDLRLPDMSGIAACKEIVERIPCVRVLILTSYADRGAVRAASAAGASGYVLKRAKAFELVSVLRRVARGDEDFVVDPAGSEAAVGVEDRLLATLSPQEKIVAGYIARGLSNREIAAEMSLAEKTVKNYVSHLLTKMSFHRRSEAASYVARIEAEANRWTPSWVRSASAIPAGKHPDEQANQEHRGH